MNEAEIDFFKKFPSFFYDPMNEYRVVSTVVLYFYLFLSPPPIYNIFTYLAVLGLSCSTQDLQSSLRHEGSFSSGGWDLVP